MKIKELGSKIRQRIIRGRYVGSLDSSDFGVLRGWVMDRNNPDTPEVLDVQVDNARVVSVLAEEMRTDLRELGQGKGGHGFTAQIPDIYCDDQVHEVCLTVSSNGRTLWSFTTDIQLRRRPENWRDVRGHIDHIHDLKITGWACAWGTPPETVKVSIRTNSGNIVATTVANLSRPDLLESGLANGKFGFVLDLHGAIPVSSTSKDTYTIIEETSGLPLGPAMTIDANMITVMAGSDASKMDFMSLGLDQGFESVYDISAHGLGVASRGADELDDPFEGKNIAVLVDGDSPLDILPNAFRSAKSVTVLSINTSKDLLKLKDMWPSWHSAQLNVETVHTLMPKFSQRDNDCASMSTDAIRVITEAIKGLSGENSVYPEFIDCYGDLLVEPLESYLYSEVFRRLVLCDMILEDVDCLCMVLGRGLSWLPVLDMALTKMPPKNVYLHVTHSTTVGATANRALEALRISNTNAHILSRKKTSPEIIKNVKRDVITHLDVAIETSKKLVVAEMRKSEESAIERPSAIEIFLQLEGNYSHAFVGSGLSELLRQVLEHRDLQVSFVEKPNGGAQANFDRLKEIIGPTPQRIYSERCPSFDSRVLAPVRRYQRAFIEYLRAEGGVMYKEFNCAPMVEQFVKNAMVEGVATVLHAANTFRTRFENRKPHRLLAYPGAETSARAALRAAREAGVPTADCQMIFVADDPRNIFNWRPNADQLFVLDDTFGEMFQKTMNWPKGATETVGSVRIDTLRKSNRRPEIEESSGLSTKDEGVQKVVMLAMQPYAEKEMRVMLGAMRRLALGNPEIRILVRPHPIDSDETREGYLKFLGAALDDQQVIDGNGDDLGKSILSSDVVISLSSNVLLEAACLGANCVVADVSGYTMPHPMNIGEWGIAASAKTEDELHNVVLKIFSDTDFRTKIRQRRDDFFEQNPQYLDMQCADRIARSLVR